MEVSLSFLEEGDYEATIYADHEDSDWRTNPYDYTISNLKIVKNDKLLIKLGQGGGQAIRFKHLSKL